MDHLVVDLESGEMVCSKCGMVVEEKIGDFKIGYESKGTELKGTEPCGLSYYDMGLSTIIGKSDRDGKGQMIQPSLHSSILRLRTWDYRIQLHEYKNRNLKRAFVLLHTMKDKFNLSNTTVEKAAYIYRKALSKRMITGRSIDVVLLAACYIAIRETLSPLSLKEISIASNIRVNAIARMVRLLSSELNITIPLADHAKCITRVGNVAALSEKTKREALHLLYHMKKVEYPDGKKPMTIAAVLLYIAGNKTGEHISQKNIAKAAGITDVTLRSRVKDLKAKAKNIV
jgi:transcription initiation factor TFIIB